MSQSDPYRAIPTPSSEYLRQLTRETEGAYRFALRAAVAGRLTAGAFAALFLMAIR